LFAGRLSGRGRAVAESATEFSTMVLEALRRRSAEAILETALIEDGLDGAALVASPLVSRALDGERGIVASPILLDRPVVALGASARLHYAGIDQMVGAPCIVPVDADVANALGAVAGQVRATAEAAVSQPAEGIYRVAAGEALRDFPT